MEAIRKQASKLREQVAKQQQALLKQLSVHFSSDSLIIDEGELQCHQQLKKLYTSTRTAKHFQKNLVRGVECLISANTKQKETAIKLANDCCRYGDENQSAGTALARVALQFGTSYNLMERERENLNTFLGSQVTEPLRLLINGAPLEDARHLTHRYERIWQEVEAQVAEVFKRQMKLKEGGGHADMSIKLQAAESKLSDLRLSLSALGREATAAMLSVEAEQQEVTYQRLLAMVDAERLYHQTVVGILAKLLAEIILEKQQCEPSTSSIMSMTNLLVSSMEEASNSSTSGDPGVAVDKDLYSIARVIHPFDAQADGELSLSVGDYVVVRQIAHNGWSEGECRGKGGWFPSAYVEREARDPASKVIEGGS